MTLTVHRMAQYGCPTEGTSNGRFSIGRVLSHSGGSGYSRTLVEFPKVSGSIGRNSLAPHGHRYSQKNYSNDQNNNRNTK